MDNEAPSATLTFADFEHTLAMLRDSPVRDWVSYMHLDSYRQILWWYRRPEMRRVYREAGYPFGRNQGAFKRWVLYKGHVDA